MLKSESIGNPITTDDSEDLFGNPQAGAMVASWVSASPFAGRRRECPTKPVDFGIGHLMGKPELVTHLGHAYALGMERATDGTVSIAALLLGVTATALGEGAILLAGIASTIAGAISMALGEYVSVSAQRDTEKNSWHLSGGIFRAVWV